MRISKTIKIVTLLALIVLGALSFVPRRGNIGAGRQNGRITEGRNFVDDCPPAQVRMLWFVRAYTPVMLKAGLNLATGDTINERDIPNRGVLGGDGRMELSEAAEVLALLARARPAPADVPFTQCLHVAYWENGRRRTKSWQRLPPSADTVRLFDLFNMKAEAGRERWDSP